MSANRSAKPGEQLVFEFDRPPIQLFTPIELYDRLDEEMLRTLVTQKEDSRYELKPNGVKKHLLSEYFSTWANTPPYGGLIIIGVRDDRVVEGCASRSNKPLNDLELSASDLCPDAQYVHRRVPIHRDADGELDFVVVFHVKYNPTKVVKTADNRVFVRRADQHKELKTPDEIQLLRAQKGEVRYETESSGLKFPADFDLTAIAEYAATIREKKGWDDSHSLEDVLSLMHLGVLHERNFEPNIACALMFAKDPRTICAGCRIRFLRFEGESEHTGENWNAVKDEFIEGALPQQIVGIAQILRSQLRTFSKLGPDGKFITSHEYPEFAWYEAIVNACAHRSYGNGMRNVPIFVKMFDDRLEVESPGPFPPTVTPETIYNVHCPRNPYLMDAMLYLKFVKCAHEGTKRIRTEMLRMELPEPEFQQDEIGHALVRVTLRNKVKQRRIWVDSDVALLLGAQVADLLSEGEKRCVNFCAENGSINVSQAQRLTGREWGTMRKVLMGLVEKKILDWVARNDIERDPSAHYVLRGKVAKPVTK